MPKPSDGLGVTATDQAAAAAAAVAWAVARVGDAGYALRCLAFVEDAYERAACALEWADRFPDILPADHLEVTFAASEGGRRATLRAT